MQGFLYAHTKLVILTVMLHLHNICRKQHDMDWCCMCETRSSLYSLYASHQRFQKSKYNSESVISQDNKKL